MFDHVLRQEQLGRPVGLEERAEQPFAVVDLVLVGVENVGVGVGLQLDRHPVQRVLGQQVVVVEQRHEVAGRQVQRSEEHTSELQSLMLRSIAVFCLKKKKVIE